MKVLLASPRGFCAGVHRAIEIVERALDIFGAPVYVRHEVVHNRFVVDGLREKGAVFVEELHEVPDGNMVIFSAHGVSQAVRREAAARKLRVFDATCPLVTKVHMEVLRYSKAGRECVLIGHAGHPEVEGTMGQYDTSAGGCMYLVENIDDVALLQPRDPDTLCFVTQTTLSMDDTAGIIDALRQRFPNIEGPRKDDICYATQNRQDAVKLLASECDVVLVVGTLSTAPMRSKSNGARECRISVSPPVPPPHRCWWTRSSRACATGAPKAAKNNMAAKKTSSSPCRGNSPARRQTTFLQTHCHPVTPLSIRKVICSQRVSGQKNHGLSPT